MFSLVTLHVKKYKFKKKFKLFGEFIINPILNKQLQQYIRKTNFSQLVSSQLIFCACLIKQVQKSISDKLFVSHILNWINKYPSQYIKMP